MREKDLCSSWLVDGQSALTTFVRDVDDVVAMPSCRTHREDQSRAAATE